MKQLLDFIPLIL
ncbi:putative intracellular septation protein A, partial [Haemophilus influenzae]